MCCGFCGLALGMVIGCMLIVASATGFSSVNSALT